MNIAASFFYYKRVSLHIAMYFFSLIVFSIYFLFLVGGRPEATKFELLVRLIGAFFRETTEYTHIPALKPYL